MRNKSMVSMQEPTAVSVHRAVYFENLDALRTIAFLVVFISHCVNKLDFDFLGHKNFVKAHFQHGELGVKLFFVLSGFLITYLILDEKNRTGTFNLMYFYVRRFLRIWPLYFLIVIIGFCFVPLVINTFGVEYWPFKEYHQTLAMLWPFPLFLSNFLAEFNLPLNNEVLTVLWSISVEEQFYLCWPLMLLFFKLKRSIVFGIVMILTVSIISKFLFGYGNIEFLKRNTLSLAFDLTIGGSAAYLAFFRRDTFLNIFRYLPRYVISVMYLLIVALMYFRNTIFKTGNELVVESLIFPMLFGFVILEQCYGENSLIKFGRVKWLDYWGKYTYGLYCYHFVALFLVGYFYRFIFKAQTLDLVTYLSTVVISLLLTMLISFFSYHTFEARFLKLKRVFIT